MNNTPPRGPVPSRHTHATQYPHTMSLRINYQQHDVPIGPEKNTSIKKK